MKNSERLLKMCSDLIFPGKMKRKETVNCIRSYNNRKARVDCDLPQKAEDRGGYRAGDIEMRRISLVSNFDSRIALRTVLHELLQHWPADRRKDHDTG
jgi:hypothetical protein